ncbi:MAG: phosphoglycerate mutase family protein [Phycisphaerae bacterium]|nr:histidine phosphatase family protein [Phycisphaerales bacterium]
MKLRSTFSLPVLVSIVSLALIGLGGCQVSTAPVQSQAGTTTTIIIVRHAERDPEEFDPPLTEEGEARAEALADALDENGVTAIFTSAFIRNRQTCDVLADRLGIVVEEYSQAEVAITKTWADGFVNNVLQNHAGGTVLWVGNTGPIIEGVQSGNLQELYMRLGGTGRAPTRYQDIYTATIPEEGPVRFVKAEYGGESSLDAN